MQAALVPAHARHTHTHKHIHTHAHTTTLGVLTCGHARSAWWARAAPFCQLSPVDEQTETCIVEDLSDGCGAKIDIVVVSNKFDGMGLLDRQRAVHAALEEEMKTIHAITMKCKTVKQWESMQAK